MKLLYDFSKARKNWTVILYFYSYTIFISLLKFLIYLLDSVEISLFKYLWDFVDISVEIIESTGELWYITVIILLNQLKNLLLHSEKTPKSWTQQVMSDQIPLL